MAGENKQLQESGKSGYLRYVQKMGLVKSEYKTNKTFDRYIWRQSVALIDPHGSARFGGIHHQGRILQVWAVFATGLAAYHLLKGSTKN